MKQLMLFVVLALLLGVLVYLYPEAGSDSTPDETAMASSGEETVSEADPDTSAPEADAMRGVLDISVHTIEELEVLFDRAEELVRRPKALKGEDSLVLVLHGPEVEFFAISNYDTYRSIVDRAARLDAFQVVDVKICQTMMQHYGIDEDDIPAFIEQVPNGPAEIERLTREGYTYF